MKEEEIKEEPADEEEFKDDVKGADPADDDDDSDVDDDSDDDEEEGDDSDDEEDVKPKGKYSDISTIKRPYYSIFHVNIWRLNVICCKSKAYFCNI